MYTDNFKKLVIHSVEKSNQTGENKMLDGNPFYIGFGNPNSEILIFGKEKGFEITSDGGKKQLQYESIQNPNEWNYYIKNSIAINKNKFYETERYINAFFPYFEKNKSGHTWNKYRILLQKIYPEIQNIDNDFFNHTFISEVNPKPSKTSKIKLFTNNKMNADRFEILKKEYFKDFKVIILACGDYLHKESIEDIFDVQFQSNSSEVNEKFVIYKNIQNQRIVINTRQLSFNVSNIYLEKISNEAKKHLTAKLI